MRDARFEPTISAGERLQTYVLDRTATGTDSTENLFSEIIIIIRIFYTILINLVWLFIYSVETT
jgi:hypothetical protein